MLAEESEINCFYVPFRFPSLFELTRGFRVLVDGHTTFDLVFTLIFKQGI